MRHGPRCIVWWFFDARRACISQGLLSLDFRRRLDSVYCIARCRIGTAPSDITLYNRFVTTNHFTSTHMTAGLTERMPASSAQASRLISERQASTPTAFHHFAASTDVWLRRTNPLRCHQNISSVLLSVNWHRFQIVFNLVCVLSIDPPLLTTNSTTPSLPPVSQVTDHLRGCSHHCHLFAW